MEKGCYVLTKKHEQTLYDSMRTLHVFGGLHFYWGHDRMILTTEGLATPRLRGVET